MAISLSNLTDAELGALVRKTLGEKIIEQQIHNSKVYQEEERQRQAEAHERQRAERRKRRSLLTLDEFTIKGVTYAPLNVAEEAWDEVAPEPIAGKYLKLLTASCGVTIEDEDWPDEVEKITWRVVWAIHNEWLKGPNFPFAWPSKVRAIVKAKGVTEDEAFDLLPKHGREYMDGFLKAVVQHF